MDTLLTFLSVASLALSVGGLVLSLLESEKRRKVIVVSLAVVLAIIIVLSTVMIVRIHDQTALVEHQSHEVMLRLETGSKTFEQLYQELLFPDFSVLKQALDNLISQDKVGHTVLDMRDERGELYRVRVYFRKVQ